MELAGQATEKGLQGDNHHLEPLSGQKLGQIGQPITGCCELAERHLGDALPTGSSTYVHSLLRIGNGRMGRRWEAIGVCQPAEQGMGVEYKLRWAEPMGREAGTTRACSQRRSGADRSPVRAPESPSRQRVGHAQAVASPVRAAGSKYRARAFGQKRPGHVAAAGRPIAHPDLPTPALFELLEA